MNNKLIFISKKKSQLDGIPCIALFPFRMSYKEANEVLNYWFGGGDPSKRPQWFGGGEEAVKEIKDKFGPLVCKAISLAGLYLNQPFTGLQLCHKLRSISRVTLVLSTS